MSRRAFTFLLAASCLLAPTGTGTAQVGRTHPAHDPAHAKNAATRQPDAFDLAWAAWQKAFAASAEFGAGMTVADIGAGAGEFTALLAERVGSSGRVLANEIDLAALSRLRDRVVRSATANVTPVLGAEHDPLLPLGETDVAVMIEVFHHLTDQTRFLAATRARLKPGGRLLIVEADVRQPGGTVGGCYSHPFESRALAERAGFRFERFEWFEVGDCRFFVLVLSKPVRG